MTVHIIEDDFAVADALAVLLSGVGHETVCYPDAESFFEARPPNPDDSVIVDLGLPGLSGVQVVRWLEQMRQPPRIIVISGQSNNQIRRIFDEIRPVVFLRKPLTEEALVPYL
ncbi:response regulator [Polymorphum gilvum]|uniref:Tetrathionate reductase complex: response regulator n=1 Tax=Polymorphum gilvum (strain LMG 25793 / CGMCC 1.9160 / SL003B-26A1) TaxID=991905 RepID=F2IXL6_POLGS|nr:response regulator [Polymorphum gilvum]ADZ71639.1 Tetrathionate reductase complex: response regulator [Polymorphum gilvum SL003B-26A1]